jgi:sugar phosphate isomerase/epimerase
MKTISRRQFIASSLAGLAAAGWKTNTTTDPLGIPLGCQIFPYREQLVEDFDGTLKQVYNAGFRLLEFCSPPGYEWGGLGPLATWSAQDLRKRIEDSGLVPVSCHYQFEELKEHMDERIESALVMGYKHMIVASVGRHDTLDSWFEAADGLNKLGEKARDAGLKLGFHNHSQEFDEMDGVVVFDAMMKRFEPDLVNYQYHLQNPASGVNSVDVLRKYPGRYLSIHIMDYPAQGGGRAPVGQGDLNWVDLFAAAKVGGIEYHFVEMGLDDVKASGAFLQTLEV